MSSLNKSTVTSLVAALLCLATVALPSAASAYSAVGDFSVASNPNGVWSYGWSYGVGSPFHLDTTNTPAYTGLALGGWLGNVDSAPGAGYPYTLYNGTANPVTNNHTVVYQPGQLGLQPGSSNEDSVVRWTAPFSGTFSIAATFSGQSTIGDSVDVHILNNGASLFNTTVIGSPDPASYSGLQILAMGATIDFVVGNGGNGFNEDTTALSATIVAVPEPSTLGLVAAGLGCLLSLRFLKRK